jgi:serine/threonine protein phosphatase 1
MSVYAITDLHGRYDLWEQVKKFLKPEDTVYYLGDAGDRGPEGWRLISALMQDPQVVYIKGNHEQILENAIREYRQSDGLYQDWAIRLLATNGGMQTLYDWASMTQEDYSYIGKLKHLPSYVSYTNEQGYHIWLSHSGCPPFKNIRDEYVIPERLALWDRDHCWVSEWGVEDLNMIIVHGHTPIPFFFEGYSDVEIEPGALWYCEDHKVCLDTGAYASGYTVLFDLDTFDEHIFYDEEAGKFIETKN